MVDYHERRTLPPPPKTVAEWVMGILVGTIVLAGCLVSMLLLMLLSGSLAAQWYGEDSTLLMLFIGGGMSFFPATILNGFLTWLRSQWNEEALFRDTFFPTLLIGNTLLVVCLVLFLPGKTSLALQKHGDWMFDKRMASFLEINEQHSVLRAGRRLVKRMAYLLEVESQRARTARVHPKKKAVTDLVPDKEHSSRTPPKNTSGKKHRIQEDHQVNKELPPIRPLSPPMQAPRLRKKSLLRFRKHGSVPQIEVYLGSYKARYLWDTGASFLTLTSRIASRLGVRPRRNAPTLVVHTANGRVKTQVGLLRSLKIGGFTLRNIAFVLCDACEDANQRTLGLLGSNVQRRFRFSIDHLKGFIELQPQPIALWRNQALDIRPFLKATQMKGSTLNLYLRRVFRLSATIVNRSPIGVRHLVYQVSYLRGGRTIGRKKLHVLPLRAGQKRRIRFMDKKAPKFQRYRMELIEGWWEK